MLKLGLQGRAVVPKSDSSDLCAGPFKEGEDTLDCEGDCRKHMHRYCAGLTRSHYQQLTTDSAPFVCLVCTQRLHKATVHNLQSEVVGLKAEIVELKALLTTHACKDTHPSCTCGEAIDNLKSDMQQLQLDVKRQASTYAETVKCGSGSKHKQHAEHHKNRQHKGRTRRGKTVMVSLMPPLPPLLPLMNHPMLIIVFVKGIKSRLQALGKYGVR